MLINVIPCSPSPNVIFTIGFPHLPETVPVPPSWHMQLQRLNQDELDMPPCLHALDKASWLVAVLTQVVFDMRSSMVTCYFVDGAMEAWPVMEQSCIAVLQSVLDDVQESTEHDERQRERDRLANAPPAPPGGTKHKKQRSLIMSIIASIVPHSNPPTPPPTSAPEPVVSRPSTPHTWPSSHPGYILRRRARSTLVDAFRRYIISELSARATPGGYYTWNAQSSLRRASMQMDALVQEVGGLPQHFRHPRRQVTDGSSPSSDTTLSSSSPFFDDETDGQSSIDTETDDSSIHTPTDTPLGYNFDGKSNSLPRTPSPPTFSPEDLATYTALSTRCFRLRQLLSRMEVVQKNIVHEEKHILSILEIKSKRRAWSNRRYVGGAAVRDVGLATPFRSSPLARFEPVTPDHLSPRYSNFLEISSAEHDISCLFPVSEDDEEEGDEEKGRSPHHEYASFHNSNNGGFDEFGVIEYDVEAGIPPIPLERPQIRARTQSMHRMQSLEIDPSLAPEPPVLLVPPPLSPPQSLSPSSLLCQPMDPPPYTKNHNGPLIVRNCSSENRIHPEEDGVIGSEFTLAMDVPSSYRSRTISQAGAKARSGRYDHDDWLPATAVEC
ncbi:hypothetical protein JAAARDRAFT_59030 [Jaapia argillacea MUCL 33604]|uniref:Uncharacterized protein n=1 Tax=Jaapia argillacea MUCL 33604 TaxID=933084 RepID=A0A067Q2F3_9AGAM|nr:hypothetical protein JAAARDRAFT_59030 [Jaapia argillacea MUCL 33604]